MALLVTTIPPQPVIEKRLTQGQYTNYRFDKLDKATPLTVIIPKKKVTKNETPQS